MRGFSARVFTRFGGRTRPFHRASAAQATAIVLLTASGAGAENGLQVLEEPPASVLSLAPLEANVAGLALIALIALTLVAAARRWFVRDRPKDVDPAGRRTGSRARADGCEARSEDHDSARRAADPDFLGSPRRGADDRRRSEHCRGRDASDRSVSTPLSGSSPPPPLKSRRRRSGFSSAARLSRSPRSVAAGAISKSAVSRFPAARSCESETSRAIVFNWRGCTRRSRKPKAN